MIRRPPRSTLDRSSAASDVYKRQIYNILITYEEINNKDNIVEKSQVFLDLTLNPNESSEISFFNDDEVKGINIVSYESVSYTHLRAHETVLDLVCRLLLEKKKKNKI